MGNEPEPTLEDAFTNLENAVSDLWDEIRFSLHPITKSVYSVFQGIVCSGIWLLYGCPDVRGKVDWSMDISEIVSIIASSGITVDEAAKNLAAIAPISQEGIVRVLFLRSCLNRDDCEIVSPFIHSYEQLEFTICASRIGFDAEAILSSLRRGDYQVKLEMWKEEFSEAYWDVRLSLADTPAKDLFGSNIVVFSDGEFAYVEEAPAVEYFGDELIFDEQGICIGLRDS